MLVELEKRNLRASLTTCHQMWNSAFLKTDLQSFPQFPESFSTLCSRIHQFIFHQIPTTPNVLYLDSRYSSHQNVLQHDVVSSLMD